MELISYTGALEYSRSGTSKNAVERTSWHWILTASRERPSQHPTFAILRRDGTSLGFFEPTEHQSGSIGYAELYIQVTDSLALHDLLKTRLPIVWSPEIYSYGRREFALRDPDGYLVIFTEPTDEPATASEPIE